MSGREDQLSVGALWTAEELEAALGVSLSNDWKDVRIDGISIDSRTIREGDLFVALSGKARPMFNDFVDTGRDGHDFIDDAITAGAAGCLTDRKVDSHGPYITCEDTLAGLWNLARFRRTELDGKVIAVTGSSGKTTFKSFLQQALACAANEGSLNNHIGVPFSLARTPKSAEHAVFEIGTNHPGEIQRLAELVNPDIAVVLNVKNAHIGNFGSESALLDEKLSIGEGVRSGGTLIVHEDLYELARGRFPDLIVKDFGPSGTAWMIHEDMGDEEVNLRSEDEMLRCRIPGGGQHRASTLAATATVIRVLGMEILHVLRIGSELPAGRGRWSVVQGIRIVDESYNANPDSMRQCLLHLANSTAESRIAIIGDMAELGEDSAELHRSLVPILNQLDGVICVGETMRSEVAPKLDNGVLLGTFANPNGLIGFCKETLQPGFRVLVKASKGVFWDYQFVEKLTEALQVDPKRT